MEIREIKEDLRLSSVEGKKIWESFLSGVFEKTFLQSWNWGEFQKLMGSKIWRLGIFEENSLLGAALIIKITAKRGTFLFCPHAPAFASAFTKVSADKKATAGKPSLKFEVLKSFLEKLKMIAKKERASFIRISPILERNKENVEIFKNLGFREAPIHMHPELTWELDITPPEEELLMQMRKTTRYLIRQAQKNRDIQIIQEKNEKDMESFNTLYQETVDRHHFIPFSLEYLRNEFSAFHRDNQVSLFFGKYKNPHRFAPQNLDSSEIKNEVVASAVIIFWQNIAFYHHGASSLKYPKVPISYLLQWEAIKEAKKRGCHTYNFWGIAPDINTKYRIHDIKYKKHPWVGLTLFKTGFGGYKKEYIKTQDFILSPKYWLNYIVESTRKSKRGL